MANGGVPYYKVDTNRYDDIRIKKLKKDCGATGVAIYDYILCQIYGGNGYYIASDETLVFTVVDYLGVKSQNVTEVIGYACSTGLFDKELRASENILTSRSIQERWLLLAKRTKRSVPAIEPKYWLLDKNVVQQSYNSRTTVVQQMPNVVQHSANVVQQMPNVVQQSDNSRTTVVQQMPNVVQHSANVGQQMPNVVQQSDNIEGSQEKQKEFSPAPPIIEKQKEERPKNAGANIRFVGEGDPALFEEPIAAKPSEEPKETAAEKRERILTNLKKREQAFYDTLIPYVEVYGKEMIRAFFDYWTEPNKSGTQMRFEMEKTWSLDRRLNTWAKRTNQYERSSTSKSSHSGSPTDDKSRERYGGISELIGQTII